jgi:alkyl hydroperoxide reductase subunit AhpC
VKDFRLKESFHPMAGTPVCAQQMQSLEKSKKALDNFNTVAVGLSIDSVPWKAAWAGSLAPHYV